MSNFGFLGGGGLFGGISGNNSMQNFLTDYAAIKNGSYYKLMKAYYGGNEKISPLVNNDEKSTKATEREESKKLTRIQSSSDELKEIADTLMSNGSKSVFNLVEKTDEEGNKYKGYDTDAIFKQVSKFVESYNGLIDSADDTTSESIEKAVKNLMTTTMSNHKFLSKIGITLGKDSRLSISEDAFKKADMGEVKSLFQGTNSYAYQVSARASMVDYAATREAAKANTYNRNGSYNKNYNYSFNNYI